MSFKNIALMVSLILSAPALCFAEAPWRTLVNSPTEMNQICFKHGTVSKECIALVGMPEVLGKTTCVAKKDNNVGYSFRLNWRDVGGDQLFISVGDTESDFTLPRPQAQRAVIIFERPRISGKISNSAVENPSPGIYRMTFDNTINDIPGIVEGLPKQVILEIEVNQVSGFIKAHIASLEFNCIQTKK